MPGMARVLGLDVATDGPAIRERVGYMPEHDCLPPDVTATEFVVHMARHVRAADDGGPRAGGRHPAARRPLRGAVPVDGRLLDRHAAAREAGPGARARPQPRAARRAHERAGPGRPRRHARADPADRHRLRHLGRGHLAPAGRARAGLRRDRRHRRRPAAAALHAPPRSPPRRAVSVEVDGDPDALLAAAERRGPLGPAPTGGCCASTWSTDGVRRRPRRRRRSRPGPGAAGAAAAPDDRDLHRPAAEEEGAHV